MRIAMFMPRLEPSALGWTVHRDFARAVVARGHEFSVLSTSRWRGAQGSRASKDGFVDFTVLREPDGTGILSELGAPFLRTRTMIPAMLALIRHLRRYGDEIDLLHVEIAYPHGATAALAVALSGWRGLLALRPVGEDVLVVDDAGYGFRRYPLPDRLVRWALRRCDAIRCISPMIRSFVDALDPRGVVGMIPVNVASRFVDLASESASQRAARRRRARRRLEEDLELNPASPIVLTLGRIHPFKGLDLLLGCLARLPRHQLVVAGPSLSVRPFGDMETRLRRQARGLGIDEKVRFLGHVPPHRVPEIVSGADVVAVPSYRESFNKVSIEAAACGTPVVVTSTTGISAYMSDREIGLVVPPRSPDAMSWALQEITDGSWKPDSESTRRFVRRFAPDRIADEVLALYRRAATAR